MPTIGGMELPQPKNWQEFENLVLDAQAQRWKSPNLQKIGRSGQKQHGVDIYGPDDIGRPVGIQCKRFESPLTLKVVNDEIVKAEGFTGLLTTLYLATTADNDAKLQQDVRVLSDKRVAAGKFAVGLIFWDDVVNGLFLNPAVFQSHYPQIILPKPVSIDKERLIAALELGYYGGHLWEYVLLTFGEFGWMAQTDPDDINATIRIIERRAAQVLPPEDAAPLLACCAAVRDGCASPKQDQNDWDPIEVQAKRVQTRVKAAASLLPLEESNLLNLGLALGQVYHHCDDLPSATAISNIERQIRGILPPVCSPAIDAKFAASAVLSTGYQWAARIYSLIDHEIRWTPM